MTELACGALTKVGASCRAKPLPDRATCISHTPERAETVRAARMKGGTAAAKLRKLEGRRLKLDSASALVKFTAGVVQDTLVGTVEPDVARVTLYGVSIQRQLLESGEVEKRLAALEELLAQPAPKGTNHRWA